MLESMPQGANILDVDLTDPQNSIFIPINTVGVMGKGLALDLKKKYPAAFDIYSMLCRHKQLEVGKPSIISLSNHKGSIVLFPTKDNWRNPSQLSWIKEGLVFLAASPAHTQWRKQTRNIHIPKLGCGLGGLEWADVRPLIVRFAEMMPEHEVYLYE
jgi:O-acetyl-ADP-ribose deacetylase (regulator of RNase III)